VALSLLPLLVKNSNQSMSLTAHSVTLKFGKFYGLLLNTVLL